MANVLQTINNQLEYVCTGFRPFETYFVDDSYTSGVKAFRFSSIKGDGTVKSVSEITLQYAEARGSEGVKPAMGFFYDTSSVDRYGRTDNIEPETNLYPKGKRENAGMGLIKKGEMIVSSDSTFDPVKYFRGLEEVVASTVGGDTITVVTGTSDTTINCDKDLTSTLKIGDWITIADGSNSDKVQVKTLASTTITTNTAMANDYSTTVTITAHSMIGEPVYLIEGDQSTETLPIQTLVPVTSTNLKQMVGYITSQSTYFIDLTMDVKGTIVA